MTVKQIEKRLEEIKASCEDYEHAHSEEDSLFEDVLKAIARGHQGAAELAKAALKSKKIDFTRYCA